jgi:dephospho-CoA kinase
MADSKKIIGLTGTNGSGKDTVGHVLALKHNYLFISVTDILREEVKRRGLTVTRENLRTVSAEWRRKYGLAVLIDMAYDQYQHLAEKYSGLAISSLRNPGEAERVHALGGLVVWVDASARARYDRIQKNLAARGRSSEDAKTFEEFEIEEEMEMRTPPGGDDASLNMLGVKQKSDLILNNDGTNLQEFEDFIEQQLFGVGR